MTERALIAAALIAGFLLAIALLRLWVRHRDARILASLRSQDGAAGQGQEAGPRIVYFTTESCVVCRVQQEPALDRVLAHVPGLRVDRHDAVRDEVVARRFGVLSVPTTAVYGPDGTLVSINRGFTPSTALLAQLQGRDPAA